MRNNCEYTFNGNGQTSAQYHAPAGLAPATMTFTFINAQDRVAITIPLALAGQFIQQVEQALPRATVPAQPPRPRKPFGSFQEHVQKKKKKTK